MDNNNQNEQQSYVSQVYGEEIPKQEIPMQQSPKSRNRMPYMIAGIVAAVVVIAGIVAGVVMNSPKVRLMKAVANIREELLAYQNPALKQIDTALLQENVRKTPHTVNAELTFTLPQNEDVDNINFSMQAGMDYVNRLASMDFGLGTYHLNLIEGNITVNDNKMYVSLPKVLKDIYRLSLDTFGADYNASEWSSQLGIDIEEDASYDFFEDQEESEQSMNELSEALQIDFETLKNTVLIARTPDKAAVTRAGKNRNCSGVGITIPKDAMNTFLDRFQEEFMASSMYQQQVAKLMEESATAYFPEEDIRKMMDGYVDDILGIRCKNDIVLYLYMDQNRIVRITTPSVVEFKDSDLKSIQITADFTGTMRALDVIEAQINVETLDGMDTFGITRDAEVTENNYTDNMTFDYIDTDNTTALSVHYTNTWDLENLEFDGAVSFEFPDTTYELSADGSYHDIVRGESYTLDLNTASLEADGKALLRVAGDLGVASGIEEIYVPEQSVAFFDMDSRAIYGMLYEILSSVQAQRFY